MTVPNQDAPPPTFGIQFYKKSPLLAQQPTTASITEALPQPAPQESAPVNLAAPSFHQTELSTAISRLGHQQRPSSTSYATTDSFMQHYGGGLSNRPASMRLQSSPATSRALRTTSAASTTTTTTTTSVTGRPGSLVIPHRMLPDPEPVLISKPNSTTASARVRFAAPAANAVNPTASSKRLLKNPLLPYALEQVNQNTSGVYDSLELGHITLQAKANNRCIKNQQCDPNCSIGRIV